MSEGKSYTERLAHEAVYGERYKAFWNDSGVFGSWTSDSESVDRGFAVTLAVPIADIMVCESIHAESWRDKDEVFKRQADDVQDALQEQLRILVEYLNLCRDYRESSL